MEVRAWMKEDRVGGLQEAAGGRREGVDHEAEEQDGNVALAEAAAEDNDVGRAAAGEPSEEGRGSAADQLHNRSFAHSIPSAPKSNGIIDWACSLL